MRISHKSRQKTSCQYPIRDRGVRDGANWFHSSAATPDLLRLLVAGMMRLGQNPGLAYCSFLQAVGIADKPMSYVVGFVNVAFCYWRRTQMREMSPQNN